MKKDDDFLSSLAIAAFLLSRREKKKAEAEQKRVQQQQERQQQQKLQQQEDAKNAVMKNFHTAFDANGYLLNVVSKKAYEDNKRCRRGYPPQEGSEDIRKMRQRIRKEAEMEPTAEMVVAGIFAQRCKIPARLATQGITLNQKNKDKLLKFLRWYDLELQDHGMPLPMQYAETSAHNYLVSYFPVEFLDPNTIVGGKCGWLRDSAQFLNYYNCGNDLEDSLSF